MAKAATQTTAATAPAAKPAAPRGPRGIPLDAKIQFGQKKVVDEKTKTETMIPYGPKNNPKREGSKAHERFGHYRSGMTVAKALEAGMKPRHITKDVSKGFIITEGGTQTTAE